MSMSVLVPEILRAIVSTTMNVLLMISLLQPKYSKKVTIFALLGVLCADLGTAVFCYLTGNLTLLAKIDTILFAVLCFAIKPLFKDTFMQWLFSYITIQNISDIVIISTFVFSKNLPYPAYGNVVIRLVLFLFFYWLLRFKIRPLYRQMVEHWNVFLYVALAVWATFSYYVIFSVDIVKTLTQQATPLMLIVAITLTAYASVFYTLKTISSEYALRAENLNIQRRQELVEISMNAMKQRLTLMDDAAKQAAISAHDRRHFNNTLLELLRQNKADEAATLLNQQNKTVISNPTRYCENVAVSAVVSHYSGLCNQLSIENTAKLDIPFEPNVGSLELAMVVANLMENAVHACEKQPDNEHRFIRMTAVFTGRILLQMENSYNGEVILDKDGYPISKDEGHGIGTKSVLAFVEKQNGVIEYTVNNGIFRVRLQI